MATQLITRPGSNLIFKSVLCKPVLCLCLATIFAIRAQGQLHTQEPQAVPRQFQSVDSFIRKQMVRQHIPGMSVSVVRQGKLIYEKGYGEADSAEGTEVTPETPFYTASVTKAFTGTSLILLEAKHRLDLDRPVNDYLPTAKLHSPMWDASAATVRRVANHTAGLTTYNRKCTVGDSNCVASTVTAIERHGILFWPPGDHFDYSNLGYGALGAVVSQASGKPFDQFLQQDIFLPLGMYDCYLQAGPRLRAGSSLNYDPGTLARTPLQVSDTPGASSVRCSSHDLAIFGSFVVGSPMAGQKRILSRDRLHELLNSDAASAGEEYSFGWDRNRVKGYPGVFAQGGTYDSFALLQLLPEQHIAIAIVANTGTTLPFKITDQIVENMLPALSTPPAAPDADKQAIAAQPLLTGTWSGHIQVGKRDIPVKLTILSPHEVKIAIGDISGNCEKVQLSSSRLDCVSKTGLETNEIPAGTPGTELELYLRKGKLAGAATTQGPVELPYWTVLKPEEQ